MRVDVRGLHKYWVLENVDLLVEKGEFIAIMGPSGSGKSTLLFLLGCLDYPTFGHLYLDDVDVTQENENVREKIRLQHIGFIFQNYNLIPTLNAIENVTLPMQLSRVKASEREARSQSLLRLVGLEGKADEMVNNLSGGQQQRVAIARALANLPGLVLADEPTGNLDARASKEVMDVIRTVNENQDITTVLVTHDPKVASYARRVYYLDDGRLRATVI
ncbi:MAG: ABC transporter ATP-binding protein [Armatimonadetes bacterium]|nr:ABC transporter ATP-binding protein [Armatimonadota bacterium]